MKYILDIGPKIVAITKGEKGSFIGTKEVKKFIPSINIEVVDTTGAGDAFIGAFLYLFSTMKKRASDLTVNELSEMGSFANAAAALVTTKQGAISALPELDEVQAFMG